MEVTKIIQDGTGRSHACVFCGQGEGIEIEDLSIDCGFRNQRKVNGAIKRNANAIGLCGSHLAVKRCMVCNYGSPYDDECGENLAVILCQAPRFSGDAVNLLAEDCVYTDTWPLRDHVYRINIMTDVNQAIFLAGDHWDLIDIQIRENYNIDNTPAPPRDDKGN